MYYYCNHCNYGIIAHTTTTTLFLLRPRCIYTAPPSSLGALQRRHGNGGIGLRPGNSFDAVVVKDCLDQAAADFGAALPPEQQQQHLATPSAVILLKCTVARLHTVQSTV